MEHIIDALVIATHPDDAEIGVGGTLAAFHQAGKKTAIIDLCDGEPTPHGSPEIRARESARASALLGLTRRENLGLKNREIFDSVAARSALANLIRELRPHTLFLPYEEDAHPDHLSAFSIGVAARFYSKFVKSDLVGDPWTPKQVFHYFGSHLRARINPSFIMNIDGFFDAKMNALRAYESQFIVHEKNRALLDDMEAESRYWGSRIYARYGEPFIAREHIAARTPAALMNF